VNHSRGILILALMFSTFVVTAASPLRAATSAWDKLKVLKPGQQIRVVLNDRKPYEGAFQAVNDMGITLRQVAGVQTLARKDILRVDSKDRVNSRMRNFVIGAAIGLAVATALFFAKNPDSHLEPAHFRYRTLLVFGLPVPAGAAIGAAIPTAGWYVIYRAQ